MTRSSSTDGRPQPVYLVDPGRRDHACTRRSTCGARTRRTCRRRSERELGDDKVRVAQIGVAGENGVLFSAIMHDVNRAAGRNGLGAVMGSKNLKAVAVRGTQNVPQGNRQRLAAGREVDRPGLQGEHGLGGHDGHAGQRLPPREGQQPARPQLPGSAFPGREEHRRQADGGDDPHGAATPARRARSTASRWSSTRARRSPISRCSRRR